MTTMKAVRIHSYGGPDVLQYEDAPRPEPAEGEVLIRIHATSINPFDLAVRMGYLAGYFNHSLPLILGTDVSGVVETVGSGVQGFKPGDEVYTRVGVALEGSYAEFAVAPAADVTAKPKSLDHIHTAALPHVTLTAWQMLFGLADLQAGQTVLVHAAAGGVGHMAVQLAKLHGARVIGTGSVNLAFVESLGVDQAVNYAATPFETVVSNVDVVLDLVGGETQERSWKVLKKGGILVSAVQQPAMETAEAHGVRAAMVYTSPPIGPTLAEVARLVDAGKLKPTVSRVFNLRDVSQAHQLVAGRHVYGNVGIQVI